MELSQILSPMVSSLVLAECAEGPDYVAPNAPKACSGPILSSTAPAFAQAPVQQDWWRPYRDPVLDQLVANALAVEETIQKGRFRLLDYSTNHLPREVQS